MFYIKYILDNKREKLLPGSGWNLGSLAFHASLLTITESKTNTYIGNNLIIHASARGEPWSR